MSEMNMVAKCCLLLTLFGCQVGESPPPSETHNAPAPSGSTSGKPGTAITPLPIIMAEPMVVREAAPPWTLTASDGSGLQLTRVDAKAVVQGPLAFTELHLYFHNPEARTREGTFAITLPTVAAVSRFAMETDGKWQEAEVVEKAVARRVYDDYLHRKQDPALLEKAAGNQFSAKVFPIPGKGDKHLVLSFSQDLGGHAYSLPLRGLPKVERVDVQLAATQLDGSRRDQTLSERNWAPDHDFVAGPVGSAAAVSSGTVVVAAIALADSRTAADPPKQLTLLVDTSASRALGFGNYVTSVRTLIESLTKKYGQLELQVVAFDQDTQPIFDGVAAEYGAAQDAALIARGAAGASNLAQAIDTLAKGKPSRRVVIVTDGVMTAGPETPALVAAIKQLPIERLDVVLAGGIRDERLAATIARAGLPHAGDVFDLDRGIQTVAAGLGERVYADVAVEVSGATWSYPRTIPAVRPGTPVMVYARVDKPRSSIDVTIDGTRRRIVLGSATEALVERAVAGAEIEELETKLTEARGDEAKRVRTDIAERSIRARVISSQTSMLVLESDYDYARYKIARTALADILVVGPNGLEQTHRTTFIASAKPSRHDAKPAEDAGARAQAVDQARQAGILGAEGASGSLTRTADISSGLDDKDVMGGLLGDEVGEMNGGFGFGRSGSGPGGGGTGEGTIGIGRYGTIGHGTGGAGYGVGGGRGGMRGRSAAVPTMRLETPTASAGLDRAIVRRYLKRNAMKIQYCYEKELLAKPALAGAVRIQFVIKSNGTVDAVTATGVDPAVSSCIAGVIKAIEFPVPNGGATVTVADVVQLAPAGTELEPPPELTPSADSDGRAEEAEGGPPLTGKLADVMAALRSGKVDKALGIAQPWHDSAPGDVLALIALGETLEAKKDLPAAARIYGSIIDLFSTRADLRRFAGERLERAGAHDLVIDTYRKAVADRPDHLTGHRLLAYALARGGDHAGAFAAILAGIDQKYPEGRFLGGDRVLAEDAGMIAAAYLAHGGNRTDIMPELKKRSLRVAERSSTRFILYWETDGNDVDFHIHDSRGGHAWYSSMQLPSGGELYADITTGYGPECFAIQGKPTAAPYRLSINYFSQGPMGYGMGLLQIQRFDGKNLTFEDRPYVIMTDHAFVDLGSFR